MPRRKCSGYGTAIVKFEEVQGVKQPGLIDFWQDASARELGVLVQATLQYLERDIYCICTGMFPRVHEIVPAVLSFET